MRQFGGPILQAAGLQAAGGAAVISAALFAAGCAQTPTPAPVQQASQAAVMQVASVASVLEISSEAVRAAYARYARLEPVTPELPEGPDADLASDIEDLLRYARSAETDWSRELFFRTAKDQFWRGGFSQDVIERLGIATPEDAGMFRSLVAVSTAEIDVSNTAFLKAEIDRREGWPGKSEIGDGAAHFAWLLVQHADRDPDFQQRALSLMEPMVPAGEVAAKDFAYLFDRVAVAAGRPQRFGSQGFCVTGEDRWTPRPMEDPESIDSLRASVGLGTMAEYTAGFENGRMCVGQ